MSDAVNREALARKLAEMKGHKDINHEIVADDGTAAPVWNYYLRDADEVLSFLSRPDAERAEGWSLPLDNATVDKIATAAMVCVTPHLKHMIAYSNLFDAVRAAMCDAAPPPPIPSSTGGALETEADAARAGLQAAMGNVYRHAPREILSDQKRCRAWYRAYDAWSFRHDLPLPGEVEGRDAQAVIDFADKVNEAACNVCMDPDGGPNDETSVRFTGQDAADIAAAMHRLVLSQPQPVAETVEAGWQPIETAPRDGTEILVFFDRDGVGVRLVAWEETQSGGFGWCIEDLKFGPYALRRWCEGDDKLWMPVPRPSAHGEAG